jgi:putative two-component system response regulator
MAAEATRALIVDDDEQVRRLLARILVGKGFACTLAADAQEAREHLEGGDYDLLVCDVSMPGESGLDLVRAVTNEHPGVASVMVSGLDDSRLAEEALERGAYAYVIKPFNPNDVVSAVLSALRRHERELEAEKRHRGLERTIFRRLAELQTTRAALRRSAEELKASREETIERLCIAIEARDPETASHISDMSSYCVRIAEQLDLSTEHCELIGVASPLHDVGKLATPDSILLKPGPLTAEERREMEEHAEVGYRMLAGSATPLLQVAATIAWTHHEKLDGSGYPRGLSGSAIPLEGRIAAVADVFDALTRDRVYRPAMSFAEAHQILEDGRGTHFDSEILDALLAVVAQPVAA